MLSLRQLILLRNSLLLAGGATFLSLILGISTGLLLEKSDLSAKRLFYLLLAIPLLLPPYLHALGWRFLVVNFLPVKLNSLLYSLPSAILILSLALFPLVLFITIAALKNLDQPLEEVAQLAAAPLSVLRRVTIPLITPGLVAAGLIIFFLAITDFGVPSLLHVNVFSFEIFSQFSAFFNFPAAFLLAWPLLTIMLLVISLLLRQVDVLPLLGSRTHSNQLNLIQLPQPCQVLTWLTLGGLTFLSAVVPLLIFVLQLGRWDKLSFVVRIAGQTLPQSLLLALLGALAIIIITLCLHTPTLLTTRNSAPRWEPVLRWPLLASLALPSVSWGILLIKIFNQPWLESLYLSWMMILLGYLVRFLPYAFETLRFFIRRVNPQLAEAALLAGIAPPTILTKIWLPLLAPGILIVFLFSFVLNLTELGTTLLIAPPGWQTLPVRIYTLLHYGAPDLVAGLSLILVVVILTTSFAGYWASKQFAKTPRLSLYNVLKH